MIVTHDCLKHVHFIYLKHVTKIDEVAPMYRQKIDNGIWSENLGNATCNKHHSHSSTHHNVNHRYMNLKTFYANLRQTYK